MFVEVIDIGEGVTLPKFDINNMEDPSSIITSIVRDQFLNYWLGSNNKSNNLVAALVTNRTLLSVPHSGFACLDEFQIVLRTNVGDAASFSHVDIHEFGHILAKADIGDYVNVLVTRKP